MPNRPALTLVELLVVLFILGLSAALVAPSLILPEGPETPPYEALLERAALVATVREEALELSVGDDGSWRLLSVGTAEPLAAGRLATPEKRFVLVVSPLGTCGPDPARPALAPPFPLDPLTCRPR